MFTDKAQAVIDLSKDYAFSGGMAELGLSHVLAAMVAQPESGALLAECLGFSGEKLKAVSPACAEPAACPGKLPLAEAVRAMLGSAKELAEEVPDRRHPGLIDVRHLACALALSREACALVRATPAPRDGLVALLASWYEREAQTPKLDELMDRLRRMRTELLTKVFGQDHAVHAFVEGLFSAEVVAAADTQRRAPRSLFVFAGPPGVGKTYLAELGASHLGRPFRRFDMSAYSGHQQNEALVGMAKAFHGAHAGTLTEFVEKNPNAVLLFDEIEKAHQNTIHLFLQILDAGILEDKYHERNVGFRDTTVIFTTNAGRKLYDRPNESGVHAANAAFHRKTILDALETETDPQTRQPFFPAAICSRMATGYPILFNHLRVNELERVVRAELARTGGLLERQYYKQVTFDDMLAMCLVLREGARADARTLRSQAEAFVKTELFKFCQLFETERLEEVFDHTRAVHFALEEAPAQMEAEARALFEADQRPRVLLVADSDLTALYREHIPEVEWATAETADDALQMLADKDVDLVLLDLWLGRSTASASVTVQHFDHVPAAARGLDKGQELLRKIHERVPSMPVLLLSLVQSSEQGDPRGTIDEELFMACVRGGGARGMVASGFVDGMVRGWQEERKRFTDDLLGVCLQIHREKAAERMGSERKVLSFDTVPAMDTVNRTISVRLRNLRLGRAVAAADAGEVLEDVERPRTRFDDVIGADAAKEELKFFIDYLKNPRRFAALGLKPPKGVLLHGPPGTGKTMLARAMAGESNAAFVAASAANFVTIWQGSGPQSVRDLFARARRYAPAIVFIDEIDAIGKTRTGSPGAGQAEEMTLNALLVEMDGFAVAAAERPVFVLAATNFEVDDEEKSQDRSSRKLDPALVRRFSRKILVDLPERAARELYLAKRLRGRPACAVSDEIIRLVAERSSGMSIANLEAVIETAARNAVKTAHGVLTDELLEEALEVTQFGEQRAKDADQLLRTARHEAGHTLLYWLAGWWPAYVTVVSRGEHGGYMAPSAEDTERRASRSRDELLASIRVSLAGRAAEERYYGAGGLTTGASQDLEHATRIARTMVCAYGMDEEFGILATPEVMQFQAALGSPLYLQVSEAAGKILRGEMDRTRRLMDENSAHLETIVKALVEKERLTADDLRAILPEIRPGAAQH